MAKVKPKPRPTAALRTRDGKPETTHSGPENKENLPLLRTSERRDFKRCPQKWWWAWREGLAVEGPIKPALWFGTGWHLVMAHIYGQPGTKRGKTPLKIWREYVGDETPVIGIDIPESDAGIHTEYVDGAALGEDMIGRYLDHWKEADRQFSMILVEKPFEVLIPGPDGEPTVLFCGTYDGVYRDLGSGHIYLLEHKTAKAISTNHLVMDEQAGGYLMVAAQELRAAGLIGKKDQVRGVTYNFARKAMADERPRNEDGLYTNKPTKDHYLSQLSAAGVEIPDKPTVAVLQGIAETEGITVLGDPSKSQPPPYFLRHNVIRTVHERNNQIRRIAAEVQVMEGMSSGSLPTFKNPTRDCSWDCPFYDMCVLHEAGNDDWKDLRDSTLKKRDPYADHRPSAGEDE